LNSESLASMSSFVEFGKDHSGLGLFEEEYNNRILWGHTGRQISYIDYAFVDPKTNESFVVMNNNANDEVIDRVFEEMCSKEFLQPN
jgi:hypothetical protein